MKNKKRNNKKEVWEAEKEIRIIFAFPMIVTIVLAVLVMRNICQRNPSVFPFPGQLELKEETKTKSGNTDLTDFRYEVPVEWNFPGGTVKPGTFEIQNPADNPYTLQVILKEKGGEELYRSPTLKPGEKVSDIPLNKSLPKGETPASVRIVAGEQGTGRELGQMSIAVNIIVP